MKKIAVLAAVLLAASCGITASAAQPYRSYTYNAYNEPVNTPDTYVVTKVLNGDELGAGNLNTPSDIISGTDGCIYITDCKNNRILKLDGSYNLVHVFDTFTDSGKALTLSSPTNVFATKDGTMYISDNGNRRIIVADAGGNVKKILTKPSSSLFSQDKEFLPKDLVVTNTGVLYVLCDGIYQGAVVFDENLEFSGYFGSNTVEATLKVITDNIWKKFATKEQRSKMSRYVPVQYSSLDIDSENFVYTTVSSAKSAETRIRKLNPLGNNILNGVDGKSLFFGDYEPYEYGGKKYNSALESISVCSQGGFAALDRTDGKVFLYGDDGDLLSVFGGQGNYDGCFADPVSLTFNGTDIAVLDEKKGTVTVFSRTEYGDALFAALEVYTDGRYSESLPLWEEVLRYDAGSYLANLGYGKALYQFGEYKEAMKYFEKAGDKTHYSDAYKEYRNQVLKNNAGLVFGGIAVVIILAAIVIKFKLFRLIAGRPSKRKRRAKT